MVSDGAWTHSEQRLCVLFIIRMRSLFEICFRNVGTLQSSPILMPYSKAVKVVSVVAIDGIYQYPTTICPCEPSWDEREILPPTNRSPFRRPYSLGCAQGQRERSGEVYAFELRSNDGHAGGRQFLALNLELPISAVAMFVACAMLAGQTSVEHS